MDNLTFISKVVDSLAWPVAVIVLVLILKNKLTDLVLNYRNLKFKYKEFEFDLNSKIESIEKEVPRFEHVQLNDESILEIEKLIKLAKISPRAAILESWIEFEFYLGGLLESIGIDRKRPGGLFGKIVERPFNEILDILRENDLISPSSEEMIKELHSIRNSIVHSHDANINYVIFEKIYQLISSVRSVIDASIANKSFKTT